MGRLDSYSVLYDKTNNSYAKWQKVLGWGGYQAKSCATLVSAAFCDSLKVLYLTQSVNKKQKQRA